MKIVKGKLFTLELDGNTFPVLTSDPERAYRFFKTVFPEQIINTRYITQVETIFLTETLKERFAEVKQKWNQMSLLQAEPGNIKFNKRALDLLLDTNQILLTNVR